MNFEVSKRASLWF